MMPDPELTLGAAVRTSRLELEAAGIDEAMSEARRLVLDALQLDAVALIRDPDMLLSAEQSDKVRSWLKRRIAGEPIARMRGWQEFYGRRFHLSEATLEPRQDTETIIEAVLTTVDGSHGRDYPWKILDVGSGTGCIAVTLLAELPSATATGTDISSQAIDMARQNAQNHGVAQRLTWAETDLAAGLPLSFDLIVSNPPYIKSGDIPELQTEVVAFDPKTALDGGCSGLRCYEELSVQLSSAGWSGHLFVEIAANDHGRVIEALAENGLQFDSEKVHLWQDLTGQVRCVAIETLC